MDETGSETTRKLNYVYTCERRIIILWSFQEEDTLLPQKDPSHEEIPGGSDGGRYRYSFPFGTTIISLSRTTPLEETNIK